MASNGNPYIKITITDGATQQSVVVFDTTAEALATEGIMPDVMADVNLQVENYKGSKSFKRLCEKISVNSKTVIKTRNYLSDFIQSLRFFTVYNGYCNLSRF